LDINNDGKSKQNEKSGASYDDRIGDTYKYFFEIEKMNFLAKVASEWGGAITEYECRAP